MNWYVDCRVLVTGKRRDWDTETDGLLKNSP